jgi:hypothetical protein
MCMKSKYHIFSTPCIPNMYLLCIMYHRIYLLNITSVSVELANKIAHYTLLSDACTQQFAMTYP